MESLRSYAETWSHWSQVPIQVEGVGFEQGIRLPAELETTIYRVVQETLTNVLKHAMPQATEAQPAIGRKRLRKQKGSPATRVSILIQRREGEVMAVIEDDGPGFDVEAALNHPPGKRHMGIFGMQERARLAGGELWIESKPGKGVSVFLKMPVTETR